MATVYEEEPRLTNEANRLLQDKLLPCWFHASIACYWSHFQLEFAFSSERLAVLSQMMRHRSVKSFVTFLKCQQGKNTLFGELTEAEAHYRPRCPDRRCCYKQDK